MEEKYGIKTVGAGYAKCITKDSVTMSHEEILQELLNATREIEVFHKFIKNGVELGYIQVPDNGIDSAFTTIQKVIGK